ncbi:MAG: hypothetical protein NC102_04495 [Clostridium sp.]|nr:hypothetical protein [Clostridium sp.]
MAEQEYSANPGKLEATALFWCLNDALRHAGYNPEKSGAVELLSRMRALRETHDPANLVTGKALSVAENMMSCDANERQGWALYQRLRANDAAPADERWPIIGEYALIMQPRPSLLHSLMMAEAIKTEKAEPRGLPFLDFAHKWDIDSLREEDWRQNPGKEFHRQSSLVEKILATYMGAINLTGASADEKIRALLEKAIEAYPTNLHLYRYTAQLHAYDGDYESAIGIIRSMLEAQPDKSYLWDDMSKLVDDLDLRIGMLCNSIFKSKADETSLTIRLKLADCLCEKGYYANALTELNKYRDAIEARGWTPKHWYYEVLHLVPYGTYPVDNTRLYAEYCAMANAFAFQNLPRDIYVKAWEQRGSTANSAEASWMLRHDDEELWIKPKKYPLETRAHNGSVYVAYRSPQRQGQIIAISPCRLDEPLPWLKVARGPLTIKESQPGKVFGFIEGAYVPGSMLYGLRDGAEASALLIRNDNNRWHTLYIYRK